MMCGPPVTAPRPSTANWARMSPVQRGPDSAASPVPWTRTAERARPASAYTPPSKPNTPSYMEHSPYSLSMQREMATLVYKKAPRSTELYPNNPATQGKNVLVNQPRAMRFKGCPWGPFADAGGKHNLRAARGSKWGRNDKDEFDVTKDLTMIPINRLPPVLQGFSRPTTHLAILEKVGAAIAVQASVRKMLALRKSPAEHAAEARAIREAEEAALLAATAEAPAPAVAKPKSQIELAQERALERAKKNPAAKLAKTDDADINRDLTDLPLHELSDYLRQFPRPSSHLDKLKKVESAFIMSITCMLIRVETCNTMRPWDLKARLRVALQYIRSPAISSA